MQDKKNKLINIIIFVSIVVFCIVITVLFSLYRSKTPEKYVTMARVSVDGKDIMNFDIEKQEDTIFDLSEKYNVPVKLEVKDHKIRFIDVNCPDKICENEGFISKNLDVAICMPNRTSIVIETIEIK